MTMSSKENCSPPSAISTAESLLERPVPLRLWAASPWMRRSNVRMDSVRHQTSPSALLAVVILTGIGAGIGGMSLALLLHFIQHIAYGYSVDVVISGESF